MSELTIGILGGGQLGSLLCLGAKKLNINTVIYCDDKDAPAQNYADEFIFGDYNDKKNIQEFINKVGKISEDEGHHPDISFGWGYAEIKITTHAIEGLSENDFILAAKIDQLTNA